MELDLQQRIAHLTLFIGFLAYKVHVQYHQSTMHISSITTQLHEASVWPNVVYTSHSYNIMLNFVEQTLCFNLIHRTRSCILHTLLWFYTVTYLSDVTVLYIHAMAPSFIVYRIMSPHISITIFSWNFKLHYSLVLEPSMETNPSFQVAYSNHACTPYS